MSFLLLLICSVVKAKKIQVPDILWRHTAFVYQWSLLCEMTLSTLVWSENLILETDLKSMTRQQIESKLYYDIIVDRDNTNHWVPALLLLLEFNINNIYFSWRHVPYILIIGNSYIIVNMIWCLYYKVMIYPGVDWNNHFWLAVLEG